MGLAKNYIPNVMLPTVTSLGLIVIGLYLVFTGEKHPSSKE